MRISIERLIKSLLLFVFAMTSTYALANKTQITHELLLSDNLIALAEQLSVPDQLEIIHLINSQKSKQAKELIDLLESKNSEQPLTSVQQLRLSLLRCFNLLEFGEDDAAISLARKGVTNAIKLKYDTARPYFMQCEAQAQRIKGNSISEKLLINESLKLAKKYNEKQAIINSLYDRSTYNTSQENYNTSIEELYSALDTYSEADIQLQKWYVIPKSFVLASISNVFFSRNEHKQAITFAEQALSDKSTFGKVKFILFMHLARIHISAKSDKQKVASYLQSAEMQNFEINSEHDKALGYSLFSIIYLYLGDLVKAEEFANKSIVLYSKFNEELYVMRIKRTLAKVYFAQQKDKQALALMHSIITKAESLEQYSDLDEFYQILAEYYVAHEQYQDAYLTELKRFNASQQANQKIDNEHFMQYQTMLLAKENTARLHDNEHYVISKNNAQTAALSVLALLIFIGCIFFYRRPKSTFDIPIELTHQQQIDMLLQNAKQNDYPLSVMLFNINQLVDVKIEDVQLTIKKLLHELDRLYVINNDEIAVLMPHTSITGAQGTASKNILTMQNALNNSGQIRVGCASLQQLDTFENLLKKARLDQLGKTKNNHIHFNHK